MFPHFNEIVNVTAFVDNPNHITHKNTSRIIKLCRLYLKSIVTILIVKVNLRKNNHNYVNILFVCITISFIFQGHTSIYILLVCNM